MEISHNRIETNQSPETFINLAGKALQIQDYSPISEYSVSCTFILVPQALAKPMSLWSPNESCPLIVLGAVSSPGPSSFPLKHASCPVYFYSQEASLTSPGRVPCSWYCAHGAQCHTFFRAQNPAHYLTSMSSYETEIITFMCQVFSIALDSERTSINISINE